MAAAQASGGDRGAMKTIRWGIIGCGDVTEVKSGPGFSKARPVRTLVAVMRRDGALAADYARRHGVARWHDDADAIMRAPDIDAVYVATHTDSHRDYVLRCAAAGKPVLRREADGDGSRPVPRDDRRVPRGRGAAVGRLLPARAAAVPEGARTGARAAPSARCGW